MKSQDTKNTMYTEVIRMKEKKNVVITFRTDEKTKKELDEMAKAREWSISQVVEKICKEHFMKQGENENENDD